MVEKNEDLSDLKSLELLDNHLQSLLTLEAPSFLEQNNGPIPTILQILKEVHNDIKMVGDYVIDVTDKLDEIRDVINEFDEEIAENLKSAMKKFKINNELCEDANDLIDNKEARNKLAVKKLHHYRSMQLLNKQNHELKELMLVTQDSLLKCEAQILYNEEDIDNLEKHLLHWSKTLEHIEEKKLERNRESGKESASTNEDKGVTSISNFKSKTEYSNHQDWPKFVYEIKGPSRFRQRICCILKVSPGNVDKTDILCECTDSYHHLQSCLQFPDEQALSGLISIKPVNKEQKIQFELPMLVYIPVVQHNPTLIPIVKYKYKEDRWETGDPAPNIVTSDFDETTYVGTIIPVENLECIQCMAVATHRRQEVILDMTGRTFELEWDRNIKITIPDNTFSQTTRMTTKVMSWCRTNMKDAQRNFEVLKNLKVLGSCLEINCENTTKSEIEVNLYNIGWFVDFDVYEKLTANQETIRRCYRWLVDNMENPKEDEENNSSTIQNHHSKGDTNREFLQDLLTCTDLQYDAFVLSLQKSNQNKVINMLSEVKKEMGCRFSRERENDKIDGVDYPIRDGKLYVLVKLDDEKWNTLLFESKPRNPKSRLLTLAKGHNSYKIICVGSKADLTREEIDNASRLLERFTFLTKVRILCRQHVDNIHDTIILCTKNVEIGAKMSDLNERGFSIGPPPSEEFGVIDGEEIEVRFEENIQMPKYKLFPLKIKFFSNIEPLKFSGKIDIVDTNDQRGDGTHHGKLVYKVAANKFCEERKGKVEIHFPKELEKNVKDFVHTEFDPVRILAKHIAWKQTIDNINSRYWKIFAGKLVNDDTPTLRKIIKDIDEFEMPESERKRCEAFILRWSSHYANCDIDKVETILKSLPEESKETKTKTFIEQYIENDGTLTDTNLEKISYIIARSWKDVAICLGFNNYDISRILLTEEGLIRQALRMLESWRISDNVVLSSRMAFDILCDLTVSLKCHDDLKRVALFT